jgi:hypothetical protein
MKVFIAIHEDHHTDTEVKVFKYRDDAIGYAQDTAKEFDRFGDLDENISEIMQKAGYLYYGRYSCEGDHLAVFEKEVL